MKKIVAMVLVFFSFVYGTGAFAASAPDLERLLLSPKIFRLIDYADPAELSDEIKKAALRKEEVTALLTVFFI